MSNSTLAAFIQNFDFFLQRMKYTPTEKAQKMLHALCLKSLANPSCFDRIVNFSRDCRNEIFNFEQVEEPVTVQQAENGLFELAIENVHSKATMAFILALGLEIGQTQGSLSEVQSFEAVRATKIALRRD